MLYFLSLKKNKKTVVLFLKAEQFSKFDSSLNSVKVSRDWHGQEHFSKSIIPTSVFAPGSGMERGIGGENSLLQAQYDDWLQGHPQ